MKRLLAATLLALPIGGCKEAEHAARPRPVVTAPIERVAIRRVGPFAGRIEARYRTSLGFRTDGRVIERLAQVGQVVAARAVLARLDPTQQRLKLAGAEADVIGGEAQLANNTQEFIRKQALFARNVESKATLDAARANRDNAAARLAALRASRQKIRETLGYTQLTAEFDGVVTAWRTEVGNQVQAGQAVVEMVRPEVREAVVDLPADLVRGLPPDAAFSVGLEGNPSQTVPARIRELGPLADAQTRTQRLRLSLKTSIETFRLGSTILVTLQHAVEPHLRLPVAAVFDDQGRSSVWIVVDGHTVERRTVLISERHDPYVIATGEFPTTARVVVAGIHSLKSGQPVRLAKDR